MASLGMKRSQNCSAVAINQDFSFSRLHAYVLRNPAASPVRSGIVVQGASQLSWLLDRYRDEEGFSSIPGSQSPLLSRET